MTINQSLRGTLKEHGIIPDVVDDFTPTALLSIEYPKGKSVSLGNTLSPDATQEQPIIRITPDGGGEATYTVVLTDPDAPSRDDPKWSEFCHWIVTGLEAESATEVSVDVSKGKQIVKYNGPATPEKTGKHRYVFLLYKGGKIGEMEGPKERKRWGNEEQRHGVRQWSAKYDLKLVGANFFFAQNKEQ